MKLEIDLDLNKIDYEAINRQIQDKIDDMDIKDMYSLDSKVEYMIKDKVERAVNDYLTDGVWRGLNDSSRREINDEIRKNIKGLIEPHVKNIFNQLPQEELDKIISDLLPKILMDLLSENMKHMITNYYHSAQTTTVQICEERFRDILGRWNQSFIKERGLEMGYTIFGKVDTLEEFEKLKSKKEPEFTMKEEPFFGMIISQK